MNGFWQFQRRRARLRPYLAVSGFIASKLVAGANQLHPVMHGPFVTARFLTRRIATVFFAQQEMCADGRGGHHCGMAGTCLERFADGYTSLGVILRLLGRKHTSYDFTITFERLPGEVATVIRTPD